MKVMKISKVFPKILIRPISGNFGISFPDPVRSLQGCSPVLGAKTGSSGATPEMAHTSVSQLLSSEQHSHDSRIEDLTNVDMKSLKASIAPSKTVDLQPSSDLIMPCHFGFPIYSTYLSAT